MTADVKAQIEYFSDVLGMKLKALYWMHNVPGYFHAFMELNPSCSIAFVYAPAVKDIPTAFGVSHAGNPVKPCAPGVMQHLAFNVDTDEDLYAMRDRIRPKACA
jgi:catechol 2,3-dioxygenase-like lactoylglutathione lyase family enzyme